MRGPARPGAPSGIPARPAPRSRAPESTEARGSSPRVLESSPFTWHGPFPPRFPPDGPKEEAMETSLLDRPARPQASESTWSAFARTGALVTLGIGVGALSMLPVGHGSTAIVLLSALAGSAGGAVVFVRGRRPGALAASVVLLAVAVLASAFG